MGVGRGGVGRGGMRAGILSAAQNFGCVYFGVARAFFVRFAASGAGARGPKGTLRRAVLLRASRRRLADFLTVTLLQSSDVARFFQG